MATSNFIDYVKLFCKSGNGGAGSVHFRREKFVPKGGPDGGDGGRGGHVVLRGKKDLWTLLHLRYRKHVKADNGVAGSGHGSFGAQGEDVYIHVPLGTVARWADTEAFVLEILEDGEEKVLLEGGKGGLGNVHFKSSTNQAPHYAQPGIEGAEGWIVLELKVLADVGLVGFPNAGKSTLLSVISAAKPKIADYAFTTLTPNLGVVPYREHRSFVVADIPGIIEGAAEGKGLGIRFLRHIERNSMLLFMIPADAESITHDYEVLVDELRQYNPEMLDKERLLAISKSDLLDEELIQETKKELPAGVDAVFISSITQQGVEVLKDKIWQTLNK